MNGDADVGAVDVDGDDGDGDASPTADSNSPQQRRAVVHVAVACFGEIFSSVITRFAIYSELYSMFLFLQQHRRVKNADQVSMCSSADSTEKSTLDGTLLKKTNRKTTFTYTATICNQDSNTAI